MLELALPWHAFHMAGGTSLVVSALTNGAKMAEQAGIHVLRVAEREVPVPAHLSAEAQAVLSVAVPAGASQYPALDDLAGWRKQVAAGDGMIAKLLAARPIPDGCEITELGADNALGYEITPPGWNEDDRRVYLDMHGGALIMGGGIVCRTMATGLALMLNARVVTVDYRMPPDHPYPAALDDCLVFYQALLSEHAPGEIVIGGASAGGNLAAALILRARDEGMPLPSAAVLLSPELDLTESGDSFRTNRGLDTTLRDGLMPVNRLYAGEAALDDPYVSPLFGDFEAGFPPTLLTAGTRDLFLSNAVRMHRKLREADIAAELHVLEAAPHGAFGGT
jgi:epsilon-lactone hydrolase